MDLMDFSPTFFSLSPCGVRSVLLSVLLYNLNSNQFHWFWSNISQALFRSLDQMMLPPATWSCCDTPVLYFYQIPTVRYICLKLKDSKLFHYLAGSGAVCLSHLDGSSTRTEVQLTMKAVTSLSNGCNEGRHVVHAQVRVQSS